MFALRRTMTTMAATSSPFTKAVVSAIRKLYPEELADRSWDNTGLLLEAPYRPEKKQRNTVLLTIDLTRAVADEAIARKDSVIIAYHPVIFKGLKSLTLADPQQETLLKLVQEGISVYSPHTAVDAAGGGLNDWLAHATTKELRSKEIKEGREQTRINPRPIKPSSEGPEDVGMGRLVKYPRPVLLSDILAGIRSALKIEYVQLALPKKYSSAEGVKVSSIAICAGSGGSLLRGLDVDVLFTGELSHHEALAATERGQIVITTFHSNSERGYLQEVMLPLLQKSIQNEWGGVLASERSLSGEEKDVSLHVSAADRDPYQVVLLPRAG